MDTLKPKNPPKLDLLSQSSKRYLSDKPLVLALSGGLDSVVLLHYLKQHLKQHFAHNLRVIHCNHHLSKEANSWQDFCQTLAKSWHLPYQNIDINLKNSANIEANARKKRYHAFADQLQSGEILCTAHHQNDQAETLLLQLFRGAGIAGMASMPLQKTLGKGVHYRPLLRVKKSQILHYAKQHNLRWIEDDSNQNTHFRRNFIRLEILPTLRKQYPNITQTLEKGACHQSEALKLTQELAQLDVEKYQLLEVENRLNASGLLKLTPHRLKNVLRYHLSTLGFERPSACVTAQIVQMLVAKNDANPVVCWGQFEVRRYQNALYFMDTHRPKKRAHCPFYAQFNQLPNFSIRHRTLGQRVQLVGKKHSQSLKKILQNARIPPWERAQLQMYYVAGKLRAMERIGTMSDVKTSVKTDVKKQTQIHAQK